MARQAKGGTGRDAGEKPGRVPKTIVLFSDGTGNSSAKLFKTNVWRLYEALDLGPPTADRPFVQIAYYDNGVGTSQFRPLALLGGIFGFGLKRNILAIYRFLCRNYQPGDRIYAFGFSRGAFTIRLLVGLIAQQGVVDYRDEAQLATSARDAWREFCRAAWPNRLPAKMFAMGLRWIRDRFLIAKRRLLRQPLYSEVKRHPTDIDFVGVWDTVAAYGGPSVEITRGIDDWIWPLTMTNYELSPKVLKARHALAIDDRRDAFQPLLWDEVREADVVAKGRLVFDRVGDDGKPVFAMRKAAPDRLEQVWFAGVHSDVGGGYPDESLSYVSLEWMIGETDLVLLPPLKDRIVAMANPFGPIHDSRAGLASYYRYLPRKIEAMVDPAHDPDGPPEHRDRILRDPEVARDRYGDHGLLTEVKLHKSVIARIENGTDGYAPINLPPRYVVYPTEAAELPKEGAQVEPPHALSEVVQMAAVPLAADAASSGAQPERTRPGSALEWARVWDRVWWRRLVYFAMVGVTALLVLMPWYVPKAANVRFCNDDRCWGRSLFGLLDLLLPNFLDTWTSTFSDKFGLTLFLFLLVALLWMAGNRLERSAAALTRTILKGGKVPVGRRSPLQMLRESAGYQYSAFAVKWYVLPFIAGMTMIAIILILAVAIVAQPLLYVREQGGLGAGRFELLRTTPLCNPDGSGNGVFDISHPCTPIGTAVVEGQEYSVTLQVLQTWRDGGYPIAPDGTRARAKRMPCATDCRVESSKGPLPWWINLFAPWRRVVMSDWLQPMIAVTGNAPAGSRIRPIAIHALKLQPAAEGSKTYTGKFTAPASGQLSIFVNDAVLPFDLAYFYRNNCGRAKVTVQALDTPAPQAGRAAGR